MALGLTLPTAAAHATIVPQKGMAGARLGMTQTQVKGVLGEPLRVVTGSNDFGSYTQFRYPHRVTVTFQGDAAVTSVETAGRFERTAAGIGVGSTETQLKAGVAGVRCVTEFGFRHCYVGRFEPGRRVTDFVIRAGKVTRVTVGFVID
jgi:hypothetical protein